MNLIVNLRADNSCKRLIYYSFVAYGIVEPKVGPMTRSNMNEGRCQLIIILYVFCILVSLSNAQEYTKLILHERDVEPSKRRVIHSLDVPAPGSAHSSGEQHPSISTPHTVSASLFLNMYQLRPQPDSYNASSRCTEAIDRLTQFNIFEVTLLPTFFWWDSGPTQPPDWFEFNPKGQPLCKNRAHDHYCYNRFNNTKVHHWCYEFKQRQCLEPTREDVDEMRRMVTHCISHATNLGFDIAVNTRVDDGRQLGGWRNTINFNPLKKYGNYSYLEAILYPIADAMLAATTPTTRLSFTLQGEMGATIAFHPHRWIKAMESIRQYMSSRQLSVGIGLNNNKLCGCIDMEQWTDAEFDTHYTAKFEKLKPYMHVKSYKKMLQSADYISVSAYIDVYNNGNVFNYDKCMLEKINRRIDKELRYWGVSLVELSRGESKTALHFGEFGIGGGAAHSNDKAATTAYDAAIRPYLGVMGKYKRDRDPFQIKEVNDYRRHYFSKALELLTDGGCDYDGVEHITLWNLGSWDVLAIEAGSSSEEGSYYDASIVEMIEKVNLKGIRRPRLAKRMYILEPRLASWNDWEAGKEETTWGEVRQLLE